MSHYVRLRRKPTTVRQLTGLSVEAFDKLLAEVRPVLASRKAGGGRKSKRLLADRLFVTLSYYRVSVT